MNQRNRDISVFLYCLFAAFACLLACSKSSPLYPINDWTDANAYFSCGKGMLAGRVMYRDLYEHKGPLLYALHALCCLIDPRSFAGVFVMEGLSVALFLMAAYRLLTLYGAERTALYALPVIGITVLCSLSFQQGDSAEELCLPMLAWSLYGWLRWRRQAAPERMAAGLLVANGALFGCVLWIKFTMVGFYIPWLAGLMLYHALRREWRRAFACVGWFALGAGLATLPWLLYFGVNNAIPSWLKTYGYDNIFLYQDAPSLGLLGRLKALLRSGWDWFSQNLAYTVPMVVGVVWFALRKLPAREGKPQSAAEMPALQAGWGERWLILTALAFAALGVFIGGKSYVYYGLILAAFAPFGVLPLCLLALRLPRAKPALRAALLCALALSAGALGCVASPNRGDLLKPREQTMQYRFAAIVNQTPQATLLNYGFMDAGFYTACNIAPSVKYFHQTNTHLQEMYDEQARYVAQGVTDYVVTRGKQPATITDHYVLVATEDAPDGFWYDQVFLYRRKDL